MSIDTSLYKIIVIGVSAGGIHAMQSLFNNLSSNFNLPILIVMHRAYDKNSYLLELLNKSFPFKFVEPIDKQKIIKGEIYIAPAGYHMYVEDVDTLSLSVDPPVSFARPSVDVLFESVVHVYGNQVIGIILTGANFDGTNGIKLIKQIGGLTIAQDPNTAEAKDMPLSAIRSGFVDKILSLQDIALFLNTLVKEKGFEKG